MKLYAKLFICSTLLLCITTTEAYSFDSKLKAKPKQIVTTNKEVHNKPQKTQALEKEITSREDGKKQTSIRNPLYLKVAQAFGLGECRLTQGEEGHATKEGGRSLGIDYACNRGQAFKVTAPTRYPTYMVQHVGMDKYMGTYVILRHGDVRYILGHLDTYKSNLKAGQTIKRGQYIGDTNESGERSSGVHTHLEKWVGRNNVSFITAEKNIYSARLCTQRGWTFCTPPSNRELAMTHAIGIIKKWEGFNQKSYLDGAGWSVGYGTKSFPGEVITIPEAHRRMVAHLTPKYNEIHDDFPNLDYKKKAALLSLYYNCPIGYKTVARQGVKALPGLCIRGRVQGEWVILKGLQKRRAEEIKILNS